MSKAEEASVPLFCAGCARPLQPGRGDFYQVTIEAVADPAPPVLDPEESVASLRSRIDELVDELEDISPREAMDQVHRRLVLHLCLACFRRWIENPAG
jgi:hypothetical protein